jgi:excisionase family DNA binding protein
MTAGAQHPVTEQLPLTLSVAEVAKLLQISRNLAYDAVRTGQIPSIRISGRILVSRARLMRLLDEGAAAFPRCKGTTGNA